MVVLPTLLSVSLVSVAGGECALWFAYHDAIEDGVGPKGRLASIAGLAARLLEHAARLATLLIAVASAMRPRLTQV